jgi:hypothetical protein
MNDDFLYNNRPPVRKAFASGLYQRLSKLDMDDRARRKGVNFMKQSVIRWNARKFVLPTLFILVALAFIFAVSGPVRARALEWIRIVAGFTVEERAESPIKAVSAGEFSPTQTAVASSAGAAGTATPSPTIIVPTVYSVPTLSLPEVLKNPPFQFGLPTWVPGGYTLDQTVGVANSKDWVSLGWSNSNLSEIEMLVEQEYSGYTLPAGEGSSEEIEINGKPALLIRGFWDAQGQWDSKLGISLDWIENGLYYRLNYFQRGAAHYEVQPIEGDMGPIIQELIRMAESIP